MLGNVIWSLATLSYTQEENAHVLNVAGQIIEMLVEEQIPKEDFGYLGRCEEKICTTTLKFATKS